MQATDKMNKLKDPFAIELENIHLYIYLLSSDW